MSAQGIRVLNQNELQPSTLDFQLKKLQAGKLYRRMARRSSDQNCKANDPQPQITDEGLLNR